MNDREAQVKEAIQRWENAEKRVADLKYALSGAECDRDNARNAAGKLVVPPDAKEGEQFHMWIGDRVLNVSIVRGFDYWLNWRKS